jgi:hypothetical protein
MSVTPLAVAEVTQRGRRKPTALTLDLAGVRAAIAELQRAERVLLAAQAAADAPGEASPAEPEPVATGREDDDEDGPMDDEAELRRASEAAAADDAGDCACGHARAAHWEPSAGAPREGCALCEACPRFRPAAPGQPDSGAGKPVAAGPDGQDPLDPATWGTTDVSRGLRGRIRKAEMLDVTGSREFFIWGDPRIDEVLAAGGTLVRTFDILIAGGAVREWTAPRSHPELFLVPDGNAAAAAAAS